MRMLTTKSLVMATALISAPLLSPAVMATPAFAAIELPSFAPLVKAAKPAVVTVLVKSARPAATPGPQSDEFREFFERFRDFMPNLPQMPEGRRSERRPAQGMGSGFIIDADGVIVTNNHVVDGATEITVVLDDGTELEAELIGRDTKIDIAVLRVSVDDPLPVVTWGDSDEIEVGDWAIAIGNPLGLNGTVTAGIVSARSRDIRSGPYDDYLQVDAAINRGNSGGPLFDTKGRVIGVNTAIISPSGGNVGLGFAIPSNQAKKIAAELLENGRIERGWIGVAIQPVNEDIAESLGLSDDLGALVADVTADSPAAQAGLRSGDVILSFNATTIEDLRDLTRAVADTGVGMTVPMTVWRDGGPIELSITPDLLQTVSLGTPEPEAKKASPSLYVPELGLALEKKDDTVVIAKLDASDTGLEPGDVILSVNQKRITDPADIRALVDAAKARDRKKILLLVARDGARRFITLDLSSA